MVCESIRAHDGGAGLFKIHILNILQHSFLYTILNIN